MKLNQKALADVELGIPVVAEGAYHARITEAITKENSKKDGVNLVVTVKVLDNPLFLDKDGKQIENRGQIVNTRYISLKPTPDYDPDQRLKELAVAIKHAPDADLNLEDLKDKILMVKFGVRDERPKDGGGTYPRSNEIERFTPIPDGDNFTAPPF